MTSGLSSKVMCSAPGRVFPAAFVFSSSFFFFYFLASAEYGPSARCPPSAAGNGSEKLMHISPFIFASLFRLISGNANRPGGNGPENERGWQQGWKGAVGLSSGLANSPSAAQGFPGALVMAAKGFPETRQEPGCHSPGVWSRLSTGANSIPWELLGLPGGGGVELGGCEVP